MNNCHYALSFHDLAMVDGFTEALKCQNKKVFDEILYKNGMDVRLGYEIVSSTHRTLIGRVVTANRVEGFERTDKDWIATGAASKEAYIASIPDIHLRKELRELGKEHTFDKAFDRPSKISVQ